jgi:hypothetical protein
MSWRCEQPWNEVEALGESHFSNNRYHILQARSTHPFDCEERRHGITYTCTDCCSDFSSKTNPRPSCALSRVHSHPPSSYRSAFVESIDSERSAKKERRGHHGGAWACSTRSAGCRRGDCGAGGASVVYCDWTGFWTYARGWQITMNCSIITVC